MTLIQEVERVEANSTKIDKSKNNINTKLIELGGESAIDLAGVPEKMQNMIIENYKKIAVIEMNTEITKGKYEGWGDPQSLPISIPFSPEKVFVYLKNSSNVYLSLGSDFNNSENTAVGMISRSSVRFYIHSIDKSYIKICKYSTVPNFFVKRIIAIG